MRTVKSAHTVVDIRSVFSIIVAERPWRLEATFLRVCRLRVLCLFVLLLPAFLEHLLHPAALSCSLRAMASTTLFGFACLLDFSLYSFVGGGRRFFHAAQSLSRFSFLALRFAMPLLASRTCLLKRMRCLVRLGLS